MDEEKETRRINSVRDLEVYKLAFALKCKYINNETFKILDEKYEHIFAKLITMERKADSFCKVS